MALIRDPSWSGPGPGPLIDDGMGEPANPALQPFIDDPYLAYGRAKYGTVDGTLGGTAIDLANPSYWSKEGRAAADKADAAGTGKTVVSRVQKGSGRSRVFVITYSDGTTETLADPVDSTDGSTDGSTAKTLSGSASNELKAILRRYGLESLFDPLAAALIGDPSLIKNTDALFGSIRETPQYQTRFKGNIERAKKNLPLLSEAEYVSQEQAYLTVNKNLGLPRGFYDTQNDYANFIANDVSPVEYNNRIQQAYNVVKNSDPEVLNQLKMLAPELQDADLAAYILDPSRSGQEIERKARAATIAAAGKTSGGMQLTAPQAESLALQGVSTQAAQQGFTQLGQSAGLFRPLQGEETITQEDILAGTFTNEQAAQQRIARRRRRRQASFEEGGGFVGTGNRNIGLTTVGE